MPPISRLAVDCLNTTTTSIDLTLAGAGKPNTDQDLHAVLYIVCTLLFYSLGIIVGIVKYLKQEKHDIEESKMFDDFIALKSDFSKGVYTFYRRQQVFDVVKKLEEIENKRLYTEENLCSNSEKVNVGEVSTIDFVTAAQNNCSEETLSQMSGTILEVIPELQSPDGQSEVQDIVPSDCYKTGQQFLQRGGVKSVMSEAGDSTDMATADGTDDMSSRSEQADEITDPFPNRRLSQVVARILDSNLNIHECDDLDTTYEDITEDELETDFIDYNEEPKNKELFRGSYREFTDSLIFDSDVMKDSVFEEDVDDKLLVSMQPERVDTADVEDDVAVCLETVTTRTDSRGTETVFDVMSSPEPTDKEKIVCSSSPRLVRSPRTAGAEEAPFRWSVTSV